MSASLHAASLPVHPTSGAATRTHWAVDLLAQRVLNSSVVQRCHTDALHCIFGCLGAASWMAALVSCRSCMAAGLRSRRALSASPSTRTALLCTSSLRRHVTAVGCVDLRLGHLRLLRELPRLTALDAEWDPSPLTERMHAAGDSREQRAQLLRDALPLRLQRFAWALCGTPCALSRQVLLDASSAISS